MRHPQHDTRPPRSRRGRLGAFAAGTAMALAAVTLSGVSPGAGATTSSGERAVLTATVPCRLADTRPGSQVGARGTPLGSQETETFAARGAIGQCTAEQLPADAIALALNITTVGASQRTFITIWPEGTRPNSSSLNPAPGQPPTPNAVTVRLGSSGSFEVYNDAGQVDVIVDVVGFYTDHDHDDRYDTSAEVDAKIVAGTADFDTGAEVDAKIVAETDRLIEGLFGTNGSIKVNTRDIQENKNWIEQTRRVAVNRMQFHPIDNTGGRTIGDDGAFVPAASGNNQLWAGVPIPSGVTVTGVSARVLDNSSAADIRVRFYQVAPNGSRQEFASTMVSSGSSSSVRTLTGVALFSNDTATDPFVT
ncbi:MAG: hypothetical protein AAGG08_05260, partial [Actinomycetota bacterium]